MIYVVLETRCEEWGCDGNPKIWCMSSNRECAEDLVYKLREIEAGSGIRPTSHIEIVEYEDARLR